MIMAIIILNHLVVLMKKPKMINQIQNHKKKFHGNRFHLCNQKQFGFQQHFQGGNCQNNFEGHNHDHHHHFRQ